MDIRIVKGEKCLSCSGKIGYYPEADVFKCLDCGIPYNPTEDRAKEARRKYWASPKGRKAQADYSHTEKGTEARKRHDKSVKGKLTKRRYYYSEKGQVAHQKHQDKVKLFKEIDTWLRYHPGKTIADYLKEHPKEGYITGPPSIQSIPKGSRLMSPEESFKEHPNPPVS